MKYLLHTCLCFLLAATLSAQGTDANTVIERARATIGNDAKLDGVVTLRLIGSLKPVDPNIPSATLLIVARKPCSQRMEIKVDDLVETTILNGNMGCIVRSNLNANASQMRDLTPPELERVIYNTRQLFNFYTPDIKNGESVTYAGIESYRDQPVHKLVYTYPGDSLPTIRYFSVEDDSLISTVTDNGVESVSVGSQIVGGIKFPERIEYYEGERKLHTIIISEVQLNKPLPAGVFEIPEDKKAP